MVLKIDHRGDIIIDDIIDGYLVTKRYIGYTKREAVTLFNKEFKNKQ